MAIEEYNSYGLAASVAKLRIDKTTANLMFGFKVTGYNIKPRVSIQSTKKIVLPPGVLTSP